MSELYAVISLLALLLDAFLLTRLLAPRSRVEGALTLTVVYATLIVLLGYVLSAVNQLRSLGWWAMLSALILALIAVLLWPNVRLRARCFRRVRLPRDIAQRITAAGYRRYDTLLLLALVTAMLLAALANLITITCLEPGNSDAISYHLPRIMYYLEHGNFNYFGASYWAIVIHPKVATVLMLYSYLIGDLHTNLTQLVQYFAYFVSVLAVYGSTRQLGMSRRRSAFAALIFSLLTIVLMEASTAQNDLVLTAFTGCLIYFLLVYRNARASKYLWLASITLALALGVKATMLLVLPSLLPVALFSLRPRKGKAGKRQREQLWMGALGCCLALAIITIPAGYGDNMQRFGHPLGPKSVREEHTFEGTSLSAFTKYGCLNLLRYGFDFLAVDGVMYTPFLHHLQVAQNYLPRVLLKQAGITLTMNEGARRGFSFERAYAASENFSYWGVLGPFLLIPVVFITLWRRRQSPGMRVFALAALVYFVVQAFASPYDPWRGRYFTIAALFAAPTLASMVFPCRLPGKIYLALVVLLGCVTGVFCSYAHQGVNLIPFRYHGRLIDSTLTWNRAKQLTRESPELQPMLNLYNSYVPAGSVVATDLKTTPIEYFFFGNRLSRRIIPLHAFTGGDLPIPPEAQYLLYSNGSPYTKRGDLLLCQNHPYCGTLFLRRLK